MRMFSAFLGWINRRATLLAGALIAVLVVCIYWQTLAVPVSFDDAWGMRLVRDFSWLELFTNTANFGYYRPLYLAWYKVGTVFGAYGALVQHVACIAVHIANSLLLIRLIRAMLGKDHTRTAVIAGILFAVNPFSVQAVALPAGLNHLTALLFAWLAMFRYLAFRNSKGKPATNILGFVVFAILSFFSNEIGLSLAGFCVVYEILVWVRTRAGEVVPRPYFWGTLAVLGFCAAYAAIYFLIPKGESVEFQFTLSDAFDRALFALQSLAYPAAWPIHQLAGAQNNPAQVLAAGALLAMGIALAARTRTSRLPILLGLLFFGAGAALPVLRLPTYYVDNAPRVFYVASAGVAITLAAILAQPHLLNILLGAGILISTYAYSSNQLGLLQIANEPVRAILQASEATAPDRNILAINLPEWAAYSTKQFPLGKEGVILMAPYVKGDDLVESNMAYSRVVQMAQMQTPFQPAHLLVGGWGDKPDATTLSQAAMKAEHVLITKIVSDVLQTEEVGGLSINASARDKSATIGSFVFGFGRFDLDKNKLWVTTSWHKQSDTTPKPTLSMFAQVFDANGAKIGQSDGALLGGLVQFSSLPADKWITDHRSITLAPSANLVNAKLYLGIYDYTNGERLPAFRQDGSRVEGDGLCFEVQTGKACN